MYTEQYKDVKPIMTLKEARNLLGIGRTKMSELVKNGLISAVKIGRCYRIRREDLIEFLENSII
jgi:DNA binding domain, excisionase family